MALCKVTQRHSTIFIFACPGRVILFGGYGLELRFWVVIAIIVSLTLTVTLITTLMIILP